MDAALNGLRVVDADTHITEPHDLWTSRAPKDYRDRVPRVLEVDGGPKWVVDGAVLGRAGASGVVTRDGERIRGTEFIGWTFDDVTPAAYQVEARLELMDRLGVWAHIIYPNTAGFGGQRFGDIKDPVLKLLCATLYNDAMAEMQEASGRRLFPMGLIPWWDIDASVAEVRRMNSLGLRGVNTTSDPQQAGLPDFADRAWDPLWEVCADLGMPVNFHIGAAHDSLSWFGSSPWPGLGPEQKLAVGSAMMYLTNARVLANFIYSGVLERHPRLKIVSVESGIGWIPFFLEALEHQLGETAPGSMDYLSLSPREYFRRQIHACFWFESDDISHTIDRVGPDNVLFETDFPHPTCLYPDSLDIVGPAVAQLRPEVVRRVMQDNAARLYNLPLPS
ncbi:amidohydrolase family protein [Planobispora longispora]|uniref:Amidohydrolase n=1 Tax=Planobispora longispora TaxID=28887 RepID=A0A8J3RF77_9ACTN|nr:amidohydrolase family protein [Planobispora longispora]GIH73605.1 amidohydrolase [Planobispora longispora]